MLFRSIIGVGSGYVGTAPTVPIILTGTVCRTNNFHIFVVRPRVSISKTIPVSFASYVFVNWLIEVDKCMTGIFYSLVYIMKGLRQFTLTKKSDKVSL